MRLSFFTVTLASVLAACGGDDSNFDRPQDFTDGGPDAAPNRGGRASSGGQGGRSGGGRSSAGGASSTTGGAANGGSGDASVGTGGMDGSVGNGGTGGGSDAGDAATLDASDGGPDASVNTGGSGTGDSGTGAGGIGAGGAGTGGAGTGGRMGTGGGASGGTPGAGGAGGAPACTGNTDPTATVECGSNGDCCASGRLCGQFVAGTPTRVYCRAPFPAGGSLGTTCTGAFTANSQCTTGLCPTSLGYCSAICEADSDCGDADYLCHQYFVNGTPFAICSERCTGDAACGAGRICLIRSSSDALDRIDKYCRVAPPTGSPPGTNTTDPATCDHGQTLIQGAAQYCTTPCDTGADCPTAVPNCLFVNFTTPASSTIVPMGLCSR